MKFYDSHFHAMTLAHPSILAFMRCVHWQTLLLASLPAPLAAFLGHEKIDKVMNLLSIMENDIGGFFMMVDYIYSPIIRPLATFSFQGYRVNGVAMSHLHPSSLRLFLLLLFPPILEGA